MTATTLLPFGVALPLAVAALLMPLKEAPRVLRDAIAMAASAATATIAVLMLAASARAPLEYWFGAWTPHHGVALGIAFHVDAVGGAFAAMAALLVFSAQLFAWWYFKESGPFFQVLMLVFLAAMVGFAYSGDVFNMFVFFELMSVTGYALTAYRVEEPQAIEGAVNFAFTNSIGAFVVLFGIALLYGRTGALNLEQIHTALAHSPLDGLIVVAFVCLAAGFFVKGAIVPFHLWLDDAHAVAPVPLCVLFSGIMVQLGLYAVARIYFTCFAGVFAPEAHALRALFLTLGIVTALLGGVMAFAQQHTKRLLAFSTVSHSGMFLCSLALLSPLGLAAMTLFIVGHGLVKGSLFMGSGIMLFHEGSVDEHALFGKGRAMPFVGLLFVLGAIALADVPPFGTAMGKALLDGALHASGVGWIVLVLALASAIDSAAVFRLAGGIFLGIGAVPQSAPKGDEKEGSEMEAAGEKTPWTMALAPALLLAVAIAMGRMPFLRGAALRAAQTFTHNGGGALPPQGISEDLVVALTAALALALAAAGLYGGCAPRALRLAWNRVARPALTALRAMHSGIFSDYVVWMMAGIAFCGAWLVVGGVGR